jgi:hypothetical protein
MSGSMTLGPDEVKVRMYRQGLGDCFLLAFPGDGRPSYVLIDCGLVTSAPRRDLLPRIAADIHEATGGRIDALVVTHEHWDHVSGFLEAETEFRRISIENLWLAWTEKEGYDLADELRNLHRMRLAYARTALDRARQSAALANVSSLLDFFGEDLDMDSPDRFQEDLGAAGRRTVAAALKKARELCGAAPCYCFPHQVLSVPGSSGVRAYVLGPPEDREKIERINPTRSGHEVYTEADGASLNARTAFLMAARYGGTSTVPDGDTERELYELSFPFDERYRTAASKAAAQPFFQKHYGFEPEKGAAPSANPQGPEWRRIDHDWLDSAEDLALRLDRFTNNTSLALAFELPRSRKVLLFPADAQVGNWLSWHDKPWTVNDGGASRQVTSEELLARTVLYKVAHHGSHNATLREKGLMMMNSPELVAMVPVDVKTAHEVKKWRKMPFLPLLSELRKRTKGRILQVDATLGEQAPKGVAADVWKDFLDRTRQEELYFEHTIRDD